MTLKLSVLLPLACAASIIMSCVNSNSQTKKMDIKPVSNNTVDMVKGSFEPVAVLELFTSQGCSSCPSADKLLGKTIDEAKKTNKNIYALSFHVDYWNRLGWADPFSDKAYSQRQSNYAQTMGLNGSYTPQLVVNGKYEFVGSDAGSLSRALGNALQNKAEASFTNLKAVKTAEGIKITYEANGEYNGDILNFALVSASETTEVKRGENGGRTLVNDNVVKAFKTISPSANGEVMLTDKTSAGKELWVIAYFQQKNNMEIKGAANTGVVNGS